MHSSIYVGRVVHSRKIPVKHSFSYNVFMMYLDLSELNEVFKDRWFWSIKRKTVVRFCRENYFGDPKVSLSDSIRDLVETKIGQRPTGPIRLLTNLSYFGYCFNPISIYYCFDENNVVSAIVAEVRNTPWGESCCYVLPKDNEVEAKNLLRARNKKEMHVSPFIGMDIEYEWLVKDPGNNIFVRIGNIASKGNFFNASLLLKRKEINGKNLAVTLTSYPILTMRIIFRIHWQALCLWLKGCPIQVHPEKT